MPETLNYQNRAIAYSVLAHIYDKGTLAHGPLDIFIPIVKNALLWQDMPTSLILKARKRHEQ